jgi:predicted DNA-binding transcriptional regulator AlpA
MNENRLDELESRIKELEQRLATRRLDELPDDARLTREDLLAYLGVSPNTLRRMVARGELPRPFRVGCRQSWLVRAVRQCWRDRQEREIARELKRTAPRQVGSWN